MSQQTPEPLLVVPEQFLPTQLALPRRDSLICGEKALMLAGATERSGGAGYRLHLRLKPSRARLRVRAEPRAVRIVESSWESSRELHRELPRRATQG